MSELAVKNDSSGRFAELLAIIPKGEENAVSMRQLSDLLGFTPRHIRACIESARREGNVICSSDAGYYIPVNDDELRSFYHRTRARIFTSFDCLQPVVKLLKEVDSLDYESTLFPE